MSEILSPKLLARYADARIPRYTSYPSAPYFSAGVGETHYRSWLASLPPARASFYLHVPFCRSMCWYCGCHTTVARREDPMHRYLDCLEREIEMVGSSASGPLVVSHVHFGGGTPTLMDPGRLRSLMTRLREQFHVAADAEVAIEIDPRSLTDDMAAMLGECGFNRASLGIQSFDATVQRAINRVQSFDETEAAVRALRVNGIPKINFDLIYGLPHQTVESCLVTVELALALCPDRVAVFGYAHVPSFKPHQRKIDDNALPDSENRFAQSRAIANALIRAGYVEIGLDHFALPDDPLAVASSTGMLHRNFQGYTTDDAEVLIGLGASAIGRMPQGFVQNEVRIPKYQRLVSDGQLPIARGYRFAGDDRLRGEVIERLMCDHRVDLGALCRRFGSDPQELLDGAELDPFIADGLIDRDGQCISVRRHARPLVRSIAAAFDSHLVRSGDRHSRAV
jgi:oxygen-independent coproporphyrinogen-3 oxidase